MTEPYRTILLGRIATDALATTAESASGPHFQVHIAQDCLQRMNKSAQNPIHIDNFRCFSITEVFDSDI